LQEAESHVTTLNTSVSLLRANGSVAYCVQVVPSVVTRAASPIWELESTTAESSSITMQKVVWATQVVGAREPGEAKAVVGTACFTQ
jgi:hypothetical protein